MTLIKQLLLACGLTWVVTTDAQTYTNIAPDQGIEVLIGTTDVGCGVSFADFDMDGWDDITFGTHDENIRFYKNNEGTLEQVVLPGINVLGQEIKQVIWVDYDNDGDRDLMLGMHLAPYRLYQNQGDMTFVQLSSAVSGIVSGQEHNRNICWGDYDRDGDLDVYLGKSEAQGTGNPVSDYNKYNKLYRNDNGYFIDVTEEAGVSDSIGITFGTVWWDYDGDGWPDLHVANDKWFKNACYHNNGDGTFTSVGAENGLGVVMDGMCSSPADYDNDGDYDMYVTNTYISLNNTGNALFRNDGDIFNNVSTQVNLGVSVFQCWGAGWLDYDNDGWQDIFVNTRDILFQAPNLNRFYKSNSGNSFSLYNSNVGLANDTYTSYSHAIGDLNNDGYPDFVNQGATTVPARIYQNSGGNYNYLKVNLLGTASNAEGIGSNIQCYADGQIQSRYTTCGENFMSQNSFVEIFGLRAVDVVDSLVISWPSGHTDTFYNVEANQTLQITEGSGFSIALNLTDSISICQGNQITLEVPGYSTYVWNTGLANEPLNVSESGTYYATVFNEFNVPINSNEVVIEMNQVLQVQQNVANCSCPGSSDGAISLSIEGDSSLSVLWGDGNQDLDRTNLTPGFYSYSAEDENGCLSSGLIQISQPQELEYLSVTAGSCENDNSGSIELENFNHPVDLIEWDNQLTGSVITELFPGTYTANVNFLDNCVSSLNIEVEAFPQYSVSELNVNHLLCNQDSTGSIQLTPLNGVEIVEISWSNGNQGLEQQNLKAGEYIVSLVNNYGCSSEHNINVQQPEELLANLYSEAQLDTELPCYSTYFGYAEALGGTPPFEYNWTHIFLGQTTNFGTQAWDCVGPGWMALNITDANGCVFNASMDLEMIVNIEELFLGDVYLFPNPAHDYLSVGGLINRISAELLSIDGRLLKKMTLDPNEQIDITELANGQYMLRLISPESQKSLIFIKE